MGGDLRWILAYQNMESIVNPLIPKAYWILVVNLGWRKLGALLYNVIIPLVGHVDVLYIVEFSFRFINSQH